MNLDPEIVLEYFRFGNNTLSKDQFIQKYILS